MAHVQITISMWIEHRKSVRSRAYRSRRSQFISCSKDLREKLAENTHYFRQQIAKLGLDVIPGEHPIVPIMLGDGALTQKMAEKLLEKGVYVIGFSYPVVPKGAARIRTQISAAHSKEDLDFAIEKIDEVNKELELDL